MNKRTRSFLVELVGAVALVLAGVFVATCVTGCLSPPTPAQAAALASEIEAKEKADRDCLVTSSTCEGYVACRKRVAAAHGLRFTGRCVP